MTVDEIDSVIEQLYSNPEQTIRLSDGRQVTKYSIQDLLSLRQVLLNKTNESTVYGKTILSVGIRKEK